MQLYDTNRKIRSHIPIVLAFLCLLQSFTLTRSAAARDGRGSDASTGAGEMSAENVAAGDSTSVSAAGEDRLKWYDMFANIPGDWVQYSEETFTAVNLPAILGMAALTAGLIATDYETWQAEKNLYDRSALFHSVSDVSVFAGDGKFQFGIVGVFAGYGFICGDQRALRTASETTEAILACGGVVQLLKHITGRESPYVSTKRTGAWRFFPNQLDYLKHVPNYDAFPSGHIATAMTTLIVITENYPEVKWLRPAGFVALGIVSSGLVATGIHWWSDIPLGLALGYSFGILAAKHGEIRISTGAGGKSVSLSMGPALLPGGAGVRVELAF
jgi:PAP2 superfamily